MSEKIDYFFEALDFYLRDGLDPVEALHQAVKAYTYVFHVDDGRPELERAADVALGDEKRTKIKHDLWRYRRLVNDE